MRAAGISRHPLFKLGKSKARRDERNFKFAAILKAPIKVPKEYDFDLKHRGIPTPMFANDDYGCCVISGRAHQTLRFELIEQGSKIPIRDSDVIREYLKQTGGEDSGLVVLSSLRLWRKRGWNVGTGKQKRCYLIKAFTELSRSNHQQVKQAIFLDIGVGLGFQLPLSAQDQMQAGKPWDVVSGAKAKINSWGGHYVYSPGYTKHGPVCVTWGQKQQMTWAFFDKYCDEAYGIIDAVNTRKVRTAIDVKKLNQMLKSH